MKNSRKNDLFYLQHMRDACLALGTYTQGQSLTQVQQNALLQDGLVRQLMILGEAANHVSKSLQEQHTEIPWADMTGMRHILVHDYFEVDLAEVWKTATADVPPLITLIEQLLASL